MPVRTKAKTMLAAVAVGVGGGMLAAWGWAERRGFLGRIETLQRSLERAPAPSAARTDLPPQVFALAHRLGSAGAQGARLVHLTQRGKMWLKPGARALAFTARQTIAVAEVGFLWRARVRMAGLSMCIVDYLVDGEAALQGRLFDALPIVNMADSDGAFRGEAMRYLAELMWNPDALLVNPRLDWRVIDARMLAVATGAGARRCEVRLILNEEGDPARIEADDRPRMDRGVLGNCPWFARGWDYRMIGGRRIPFQAEVGWTTDGVDFIYWRGKLESWSLEA